MSYAVAQGYGPSAPGDLQGQRGRFDGSLVVRRTIGPLDPQNSARRVPLVQVDEDALAGHVQARLNVHDEEMRRHFVQWHENRLFRHGFSEEEKRELYGGRRPGQSPAHQNYYPNIIRPAVQQHLNLILDHTFAVSYRAASFDLEDEIRADVARAVGHYQDLVDDPKLMRKQALDYAADCGGLAFASLRWDPAGGSVVGYDDDGWGPLPVYEGMVRKTVHPPWEWCWDPDACWEGETGIDRVEWMARRMWLSRSQLARLLTPEQMERVRGGSANAWTPPAEALSLMGDPSARRRGRYNAAATAGRFSYVEYYQRRDPDEFRAGLYVRMVNGCIVDAGVAPFASVDPEGELDIPVVAYNHAYVPGRFLGVAPTDMVRDIQRAVNASESSRLEAELAAAYRKIFLMGVDKLKGGYRTEHAQVFCLPASAKVQVVDMPPPKADEHATMMIGKQIVSDLTGVHDVSVGRQDFQKTATETSTLRDADHVAGISHVLLLNLWTEEVKRRELMLAAKLYNTPRQIKITGDAPVCIEYFTGADLGGFTDVEVKSDTFLPAGREARINALSQVASLAPMVGDEPLMTADQILEAIDFKSDIYGDVARNKKVARREAVMLLMFGAVPEFWPAQDHRSRISVYRSIMETSLFATADPRFKQLLQLQIDLREMAYQAQKVKEMAAQGGMMQPAGDKGSTDNPTNKKADQP